MSICCFYQVVISQVVLITLVIINAIGGEQKHCDYRTSMKCQRDRCTMEMGPLLQAIADGDTVAFVYDLSMRCI